MESRKIPEISEISEIQRLMIDTFKNGRDPNKSK